MFLQKSNLAPDDPLWKLLDIDVEAPFVNEDVQEEVSISSSPFVLEQYSGSQLESSQEFVSKKELLTVSSPGKEPFLTLFGRARLGLNSSTVIFEDLVKPEIPYQNEDVEVQCNNEVGMDGDISEGKCDESKSKELTKGIGKRTSAYSPTGSLRGVGENVRKLYRSMHVPVPKPLPSLVDLLNDRKRAKRRFML